MKYRLSNGLLIVGMALCMIVTIHSFLLIGAIIDAVHAHEKYALTEAYHIGNSDIELVDVSEGNYYEKVPHNLTHVSFEALAGILASYPADYSVVVPVRIGNTANTCFVSVWLSPSKEKRKMKAETRSIASPTQYSGNILIGESWLPFVEEINGIAVMKLGGACFEVVGIYDGAATGGEDDTINLLYSSCSDTAKEMIDESFNSVRNKRVLEFRVYSDKRDDLPTLAEYSEKLKEISLDVETRYGKYSPEEIDQRKQESYFRLVKVFVGLLFVFSFVNLSALAGFLLAERYEELVVRKLYGCRWWGLVKTVGTDILKDSVISFVLAVLGEVVLQACTEDGYVGIRSLVLAGGGVIACVLLVSTVILIAFLRRYSRISIVSILKE